MAKPTRLKFTGKMTDIKDGAGNVIGRQPEQFYNWAPARDLDETDLANFSAAQVKALMAPVAGTDKALYVDATPEPEPEVPAQERASDESQPADDKPAAKKGK